MRSSNHTTYNDYRGMQISVDQGVSPVGGDTLLLAKSLEPESSQSLLDLGTGSGFVAIYAAILGLSTTASDINSLALKNTDKNAKINNVTLRLVESNLFDKIASVFDIIIFNPPYGSSNSPKMTLLIERLKSIIPKENEIIRHLSFRLVRNQRKKIIRTFLMNAFSHLAERGHILLVLHTSEMSIILNYNSKLCGTWRDMNIVKIYK